MDDRQRDTLRRSIILYHEKLKIPHFQECEIHGKKEIFMEEEIIFVSSFFIIVS